VVSSLAALSGEGGLDQRVKAIRGRLRGLDSQLQPADGLSGIIGSTVVVLVLEHDRAACIWAGDSRCYLWRGQRLYQLSRDHSLQQHLMDKQHLSPELAQAHPGAKALTRAIGARQPLSLEVLELGVHAGDVFLLCSDGLYQGLSHSALGSAMSAGTPRQVVDRLFSDVLRGPAPDDLTAVVVQS
jgi:serine/threonine-protein phosphatase Stp1